MISLVPHNWNKFQHYKARRPPWIKLHRELLDDFKWHSLPLASKALAPMLWLLASEHEQGLIMGDEVEIAFRLRVSREELETAINSLKEAGLFDDASITLAGRLHLAPESRSESESETEDRDRGRRKRGASTPDGALALAKNEKPKGTTREEWERRVAAYDPHDYQTWKATWGPKPDKVGGGHIVPSDLLVKWRQAHSPTLLA